MITLSSITKATFDEPLSAEELAEYEAADMAAQTIDHTWCYCQDRSMSVGGCIYCHEDK